MTKNAVPLYVDLDGTLVKSDTLVDSCFVLLRQRPTQLPVLMAQLLHGKAAVKSFLSHAIALDVEHLPYHQEMVRYLQAEKDHGRAIYLATGADAVLAHRVAGHLKFFDGVLGSDGTTNLIAHNKLARIQQHAGAAGYGYIGNALPDLPLLAAAAEPMIANATLGLRIGLRRHGIVPIQVFRHSTSPLRVLLKAIRLHQWAKNILIFLPLLLAHSLQQTALLHSLLAFVCFGLTASATYMANDLLDIEADRRHPRKRLRTFASGEFSVFGGCALALVFLGAALLGAATLVPSLLIWLLVYLVLTLSYTFYFKQIAIWDVLLLAGLYTLRIEVGGAVTATPISHWLEGFSVFLFLSLAFVKRFSELEYLNRAGMVPRNGRGYIMTDIEQLRTFGTASAFAAVVVFANYISGHEVTALYRKPSMLWLTVPLMVLWMCRTWLLASRGKLNEDPVLFAVTDKVSLAIGVAMAGIVVLAL